MQISLSAQRVTSLLLKITSVLLVLHVIFASGRSLMPALDLEGLSDRFNMLAESSIPTVFAVLLLAGVSLLCLDIAHTLKPLNHRFRPYWLGLAGIFMYLAFDEGSQIHENIGQLVTGQVAGGMYANSVLFMANWVVVAIPLIAIFLVLFWRFFAALPSKSRLFIMLGMALWVSGAVVMEFVGAYADARYGLWWIVNFFATIEETFELFGIIAFLHGTLLYRVSHAAEDNTSIGFKA